MANWKMTDGHGNSQVKGLSTISGAQDSQGLYATSTTQNYPLGQKLEFDDGRIFRYSHFVAAGTKASLQSQDVSVSAIGPIDGKVTAAATGAIAITLTDTDSFSTADVADVYAGGYLFIEDDTGEGHYYRIRSNDAGTAAGVMALTLYDGLAVALDTTTDVAIVGNMYKNLKDFATATDGLPVGIPTRAHAAGAYGWLQTWGPCSALADFVSDSDLTIGTPLFASDGGAGVSPIAGVASNTTFNAGDVDTPYVGYLMHTATNAAHVAIFLQLGH